MNPLCFKIKKNEFLVYSKCQFSPVKINLYFKLYGEFLPQMLEKYFLLTNENHYTSLSSLLFSILELKAHPIYIKLLVDFCQILEDFENSPDMYLVRNRVSIDFNHLFQSIWNHVKDSTSCYLNVKGVTFS